MLDCVSLLVSQGHVDAGEYPLWWLYAQTEIARHRLNQDLRTSTTLLNIAVTAATAMSKEGGKKAHKALKSALESLE